MSTIYRITAIGSISLIIGIGTNQFIHQGIRWPILLLALPRAENALDLTTIPVEEAQDLLLQNQALFIDIRPQIEFEIDHIPGALSMPFTQYFGQKNLLETHEKAEIIIVYGFEPLNKEVNLFVEQFVKQGFNRAQILRGGFAAWIENRYPLETGDSI